MHPVGSSSKRKSNDDRRSPFVKILEQPARVYRFRYVSEGRGGSIPGLNSTDEIKTFPTIQVMNYVGPATVVVSCVTKNAPHNPHPNKLLGTGCVDGVCTLEFNQDMKMVFDNLGIQRVLRPLERMDMNTIRLCFQVILEVPTEGTFYLKPAISEPIASKNTDLMITKLSHCSALCTGGQEIILLCENITRDNIIIQFFEIDGHTTNVPGWVAYGTFLPSDVHHNVAISFRTPPYKSLDITEPVTVQVQLKHRNSGATSKPRDFQMLPVPRVNFKPAPLKSSSSKSFVLPQQPGISGNLTHNVSQTQATQPQTSRFTSNIFGHSGSPQVVTQSMPPTEMCRPATSVISPIFEYENWNWSQSPAIPTPVRSFQAEGSLLDDLMKSNNPRMSSDLLEMENFINAIEFQPRPSVNSQPTVSSSIPPSAEMSRVAFSVRSPIFNPDMQSNANSDPFKFQEYTPDDIVGLCLLLDANNSVEMKDLSGTSNSGAKPDDKTSAEMEELTGLSDI